MFGIDFEALLLLAVLAFILFGPQKLPEYAAKLGCLLAKLKDATAELNQQCQTSFPDLLQHPAKTFPKAPASPLPTATQPGVAEMAGGTAVVQPAASELNPEFTAQTGGYEHPCPMCAHLVSHDFAFCPNCGHHLKSEATPTAPSQTLTT